MVRIFIAVLLIVVSASICMGNEDRRACLSECERQRIDAKSECSEIKATIGDTTSNSGVEAGLVVLASFQNCLEQIRDIKNRCADDCYATYSKGQ